MESTSANSKKRTHTTTDLQPTLPQATDVEEAVLGTILVDQNCLPIVVSLLAPESFYQSSNRTIYQVILDMYRADKTIDIITVVESLRNSGSLKQVGGSYYISSMTSRIASSANIEAHCRIIQQAYIKRIIIESANTAMKDALDPASDSFDCLDRFEKSINDISTVIVSGSNIVPVGSIFIESQNELQKRELNYKQGKITGIPTGLAQLDKHTKGFQDGELIILAGRPSMGKSALMLHFAIHAGLSACIYSLEMPKVSLVNRLILSLSRINPDRFAAGAVDQSDWSMMKEAGNSLRALPIYIDDNALVSTRYIKAHSKVMQDKGQCDIIFVDYLQLLDMRSDQAGRNREQEVSQASRELKIIAKTLNVPVVVLSQLSRAVESRGDKRPMLSDLRDSGAIEQDADIVMFAYRPEYYGIKTDEHGNDLTGVGLINVAKGRNIGTKEIPFKYNESMTNIYDYDYKEVQPF